MVSDLTMVFDLESHSGKDDAKLNLANERYTPPEQRHCGVPGPFTRLAGAYVAPAPGYVETTDVPAFARLIGQAALVVGHNILSFDLSVLNADAPGTVDVLAMTRQRRVLDTMVTEFVLDPPENDDAPNAVGRALKRYGLHASAQRRGLEGKQDWHGDWCRIPVDDPDYRSYLQQDVMATRELAAAQMANPVSEYVWREHRVQALAAVMSSAGVEVDQDLLQRRFWTTQGRKAQLSRTLVSRYGLPTTKSDGKPAESPHATKEGKAALVAAFLSLGVPEPELPRTAPSKNHPAGQYSFGGESMRVLGEQFGGQVADLCEVVADLAGQRTVYGTALENLHEDGRVHPAITTFQASGRWSVTKPGLTVFGKRGGRVRERAVFRASQGHRLMAFDLAQIDMRAIAAHSQDPVYIDVFTSGRDLHSEIAARLWGGPSTRNPRRDTAKAAGHGWNYGMQPEHLSETAGIPLHEAQEFDRTMQAMFPQLMVWRDYVRRVGKATGVLDNGFGRQMRCNPRRAFTQAPALMGQGTARDLMMEAMLRLPDDVARMLRILVHDEIVLEIPEDDVDEVAHVVMEAMSFDWAPPGCSIPVPIRADASKPGRSWAECYGYGG